MPRDSHFNEPIVKQFEFDEDIARVFDDMVSRSVPFYTTASHLIVEYASKHLQSGDVVYDLGCSTASTLLAIEKRLDVPLQLIGVDSSTAMLEQAEHKIHAFNSQVQLHESDITQIEFSQANLIIASYTLQFIRPMKRDKLIQKIYDALEPGGIFIMSEKVIMEDSVMDKEFIDLYYAYKKEQGYSEYEISQKREALENVLVPYTYNENVTLLKEAGFDVVDTLFRWVNFTTFIAKKSV